MSRELYFNHAGTSWPKPQPVRDVVAEAMHWSPTDWSARFDKAHRAIADFFGIQDHPRLLLTPGCTSSLAVGLADIDLDKDRRILTSAWEHHALHRPLLKLAEAGSTVEVIPARDESSLCLETMEDSLRRGGIGLVAITAASNVTGERLPVHEIIELAHRYDAQVLIDAAQVVGWVDLDFDSLGADLVAFGGHKGLQGPWGIGGLYVAPTARMQCVSATCDLGSGGTRIGPGYCDVGSVDQIALAGLHAAVEWLGGLNRDRMLHRALDQIRRFEVLLGALGKIELHGRSVECRMPTLAYSVEGCTSTEFARRLASTGVIVGSGLQCSPLGHATLGTETHGVVRMSVGINQSDRDVDWALDRLGEMIKKLGA